MLTKTQITINLLTSPIPSSVPGPLIARLTSKWILFVDLSGNRALTVHALHRKYGPVVRLAPNELSFAQKDAVKPIYGIGATVIKSPVYDNFGRRGMFQMQDPHEHRERQRRVSHIFSAGTLQQMEPLIRGVVDKTVEAMEKGAGGVADAMHWCRMMALDVAGEVLMGRSFGAFEGEETAPLYIHNLDDAFFAWALEGVAPSFYWMLQWLPMKRLQAFLGAGDYIYRYGRNAVHDYLNRHGRTSNRRTLLTKLITGNTEAKTEPLPDEEIITEVSNLTFAAVDTTGTTAAYALYRLACHPEWQDKLREEIRASRVAEDDFPIAAVQALPVLNAILTETLRLHPVAPGALPRMTAAPTQIGGLLVPAGVSFSSCNLPPPQITNTKTDSPRHASLHHAARSLRFPRPRQLRPLPLAHPGRNHLPWQQRHAGNDDHLGRQGPPFLSWTLHGYHGDQTGTGEAHESEFGLAAGGADTRRHGDDGSFHADSQGEEVRLGICPGVKSVKGKASMRWSRHV